MKSTLIELFLCTLVLVLIFQSPVASKYVFGNVEYEKVGGQVQQKRNNKPSPPVSKCQCTQAIAEFGEDATDPSCIVGSVQFVQNPCGQLTMTGVFQSGFQNTAADYKFKLVSPNAGDESVGRNETIKDITKFIDFKFFRGGLKTWSATTSQISLNCNEKGAGPNVLNQRLYIYVNNDRAGSTTVRKRHRRG
ncbi:2528_t:CDS:1 [Paraglomus brasilianum]|uniref:2528_t:CDS:1 n=1 Tax=Paraglomus brasilianum TaxID=144538 RepID=A0A9N9CQ71_9GLOM|nr:2528_t:CDS:1 [Paraglomus brasilianum]